MMLVAYSLSFQEAAALILVYLNPEEARSSGPGKLSSHDTDVPIPWPPMCHVGPACVVLNTDPTVFPVPLCFPRALFVSLPFNL